MGSSHASGRAASRFLAAIEETRLRITVCDDGRGLEGLRARTAVSA